MPCLPPAMTLLASPFLPGAIPRRQHGHGGTNASTRPTPSSRPRRRCPSLPPDLIWLSSRLTSSLSPLWSDPRFPRASDRRSEQLRDSASERVQELHKALAVDLKPLFDHEVREELVWL